MFQEIDLGGSRVHSPQVTGAPVTVSAYDYRDRVIDWDAVPVDAVVEAVLYGNLPLETGSFLMELYDVTDMAVAVADLTPITQDDDEATPHTLTIPRANGQHQYRLRAAVTGVGDDEPVLFWGSITIQDAAVAPSDCPVLMTAVANQALGFLGVSDALDDYFSDNRADAAMVRTYIEPSITQVLRAFPWGFATAYADLAWVAGSPSEQVNIDWYYSYRLPTDAVYVRRVIQRGAQRRFDRDSPLFRRAANDDTGGLLHSNYADPNSDDPDAPTLPVEYTKRADCVLADADALFTEALAWLLAHKLAPSVSRNKVTAAECWQKYVLCLATAKVQSAAEQQKATQTQDAGWIQDR